MRIKGGNPESGSSQIEFLLVGIPVIFIINGIFEISRGMWIYDTLCHATHTLARHIAVHGSGCTTGGNTCSTTVGNIAQDFQFITPGLDPSQLNLTLTSSGGTVQTCSPLSSCTSSATAWPPTADAQAGNVVKVSSTYPFLNALAMWWPGSKSFSFAQTNFKAYSSQPILF
jgi:Flp pilus assembly protein TadG